MPTASMAAVVHYALEKYAVELREVPRPGDLVDDDVLLSTRAVGVCGSEIHQYHNTQSWPVNLPVILGHEVSGLYPKRRHSFAASAPIAGPASTTCVRSGAASGTA